jgi:hypothetical protein
MSAIHRSGQLKTRTHLKKVEAQRHVCAQLSNAQGPIKFDLTAQL